MRILHLLDHSLPLHSGYTFRSRAILRAQQNLGWSVKGLTTLRHIHDAPIDETIDGIEFHRTPAAVGNRKPGLIAEMSATTTALNALVDVWKPEIIHAHSPALNAIPALRVARKRGIPVVYEVRAFWEDAAVDHGTTTEGSLRYRATRMMETYALKRANAVTTICEGLRADIVARGISSEKVTVIPNAVDADAFTTRQPANAALSQKLGLAGHTVLGFLGSYYAYEGLDLLLKAVPIIALKIPNVKVLLVGGGPQEAALKAQAQAMGIADRVIFIGRVPHEDVHTYYDLVDLLVYPRHSLRVTELVTPLKPLEAMAQQHLLLASNVGGHRELIEDGKTGYLFKADDEHALAQRAVEILTTPEQWPAIRKNGRAFVESVRNWKMSVDRYQKVYAGVLGAGG